MKKQSWFSKLMLHLFGMNPPPKKQSDAGAVGGTPPVEVNNPPPSPAPTQPTPAPNSEDFAGLTFRNSKDCSAWPVTVAISSPEVRGGNIAWKEAAGQREARNWNEMRGSKIINGECIMLAPSMKMAGMFDYLRVGQTLKILSNLAPSHEGAGFFPGWVPKKGERVGFCIATISRNPAHTKMQERSNVCWFTWPRDGV